MSLASAPIPVFTSANDVHSDLAVATKQAARWDALARDFEKRFGRKPTHVIRAPGRVNIIGEHIDYALFGVFPTAIEQDILIACAPRPSDANPGLIVVENTNPKYTRQEFTANRDEKTNEWDLGIDKTKLRWESYVKAGYYGVLTQFLSDASSSPVGSDMLFTSTVPAGSGVSSSAAMVVASTLAFLTINGKVDQVNKGQLIEMCVKNENRVGVNSGGMDQSASILSLPSAALYISFHPNLNATAAPLPLTSPPAVFILANSLVVSEKHITAKWQYNLRVVETLVGARILALKLGVEDKNKRDEKLTYKEVLGRWWVKEKKEGKGELSEAELKEALKALIASSELGALRGNDARGWKMEEMITATQLSKEEFDKVYLTYEVEAEYFQIHKRAVHVFTEALRVLEFRDTLQKYNTSSSTDTDRNAPPSRTTLNAGESEVALKALGDLMDESQESCDKMFDCSCKELNELVILARKAGALGSRLTGAGWGGCCVSLVPVPLVDSFIMNLRQNYAPYKELNDEAFGETVWATGMARGAFVFKYSS